MASSGELKKSITWLQGTAMTIGAVIGAGILVLPAIAADIAGPASLASWLLMGLISLPMLAAIAQMSSRYPNSGGIAAYAQQAFGPGMGRLAGFLIFCGCYLAGFLADLAGTFLVPLGLRAGEDGIFIILQGASLESLGSGVIQFGIFPFLFDIFLTAALLWGTCVVIRRHLSLK